MGHPSIQPRTGRRRCRMRIGGDGGSSKAPSTRRSIAAAVFSSAADEATRRSASGPLPSESFRPHVPPAMLRQISRRLPLPESRLASKDASPRNLHDLLVELPKNDNCGLGVSASGTSDDRLPTVLMARPWRFLQTIFRLIGLASALKLLAPVLESGQAFALCGMGDGYLLHQLAQNPPRLFMDTQQSVFVLEPNAHVLADTTLMIHDYSGPATGPIEQRRFHFFCRQRMGIEVALSRVLSCRSIAAPCPHISHAAGIGSRFGTGITE